jgi:hypothetical protein
MKNPLSAAFVALTVAACPQHRYPQLAAEQVASFLRHDIH